MVGDQELEELRARKEQLVRESDLNRSLLLLHVHTLRAAASSVEPGVSLLRKTSPALVLLAPALGFWLARKGARAGSIAKEAALLWWLGRKLLGVWRRLKRRAGTSAESGTASAA